MRAYGVIKSNLKVIEEKHKTEVDYSIDSLLFETPEGEEFCIDFEEGDFAKEDYYLSFRLKSLGITYKEEWTGLARDNSIAMEQDYSFLRKCKLREVRLYLSDQDNANSIQVMAEAKFKVYELYMHVNEGTIYYKTNKVAIVLS